MTQSFQSDNILTQFCPTLAALCCFSAIRFPETIRPEHAPLLVGVDAVREKGALPSAPQIATRYNLILPGSNYSRISVKVEERAPSVTQEALERCPSGVRVNIEGFTSGAFLTNDGGARPYFKATKITPIQTQQASK